MGKFKTGDMVIVKDDFIASLTINPVEISGTVDDESQKRFGDYYIDRRTMSLDIVRESCLTTVDELGEMEIYLTDGEYTYLQILFETLVKDENASKISQNNYCYCNCQILLKSNRDGYNLTIKLIAGGMRNIIFLCIEIGKFFELKKDEIYKNSQSNSELRRKQDNEEHEFNKRWNEWQDK